MQSVTKTPETRHFLMFFCTFYLKRACKIKGSFFVGPCEIHVKQLFCFVFSFVKIYFY